MVLRTLNHWVLAHCGVILLTVGWYLYTNNSLPFAAASAGSFIAVTWALRRHWGNGYWLGGPGNWITWFRLGLTLLLLALAFSGSAAAWWLAVLGLLEITLDTFDGYFARRYNTQSHYGEYFDKEADAIFVMAVTMALYERNVAGWWILLLGIVRFVYAFVAVFLQAPQETAPRTHYGRFIAGVVMIGLPLAFLLPGWLTRWGLPMLGLLLAYSFSRGFVESWLAARRAAGND